MTDSQGMPNYPGDQPNQPGGQPNYPGGQPGGYQPGPPPSNNLVWAILTTILCCLPFGIVSIVQAAKVNGLWAQGQTAAAQEAANSAKKWAIISAIVGVAWLVLWIILMVAGVFAGMGTSTSSY
ncbi:CD225/dispanin family protein [Amycolatopsis tolypomycina]|uniref:Interferon-induced transmembrane protein n=1 Tax=Amycolatopsis tolypomycina TaxID=208445 RepID=A0A1H4ZHP6_9PSEU|nr:CD225/dispanin family protein [Amycolatopsis tolypomycina]SED28910.1 Interferon-induced transmembrane protein [Amycolatopsis tolypomycina]